MKTKVTLSFLFVVFSSLLIAQEANTIYLFKKFERGKVIYRNGRFSEGAFNYDLLGKRIVFQEKEQIFEFVEPETVDYLNIQGHIFEHIRGNDFYEKVRADSIYLYIHWYSSLKSKGKVGAMGVVTHTRDAQDVNPTLVFGSAYNFEDMKTIESLGMIPKNKYFLKLEGKFKQINSFDSLAKLFKEDADKIKEFVREQDLKWADMNDIVRAVSYASQFLPKEKM
ncbi:MAG: hypothetical protein E6772_04555 [Dysgonomonas sp.]|nr:hypothetical protein [Dysgonomonas sp.]